MRKRTCLVWLLTICLTLALQTAVFAGETPSGLWVTAEPTPLFADDGSLSFPRFLSERASALSWDKDSNCYKDQLQLYCDSLGDQRTIEFCTAMEEAFLADWESTSRIGFKDISFNSGARSCWATPTLISKTWSVAEYQTKYGYGDVMLNGVRTAAWKAYLIIDTTSWWNEHMSEWGSLFSLAATTFVADHPEYFWVRAAGGPGWERIETDTEWTMQIFYGFLPVARCETLGARTILQTQIKEVVAELSEKTEGLPTAKKVAYWDNWLANRNDYNETAADGSKANSGYPADVDSTPWSVISGLLPGYQPVCEGYAKALQLLCHEANIPCVQVSGNANGGGHMWTAIQIDSKWYFCDPTWDDPTYTDDGADMDYSTRFYLLTAQPKSHTANDYYGLGTPSICGESVFPQKEVPTYYETYYESIVPSEWQLDEQDGVCGLEIGSNTMVIALYGEGGKFLGVGTCEAMRWSASEYIYLAPAFDKDLLEQAVTARRLNITDALTWTPVTAALPIE